jgi:hypothetical protein
LIELKLYVLNILCRHDNLDPNQTPLEEALITRHGRPCGLYFQVLGPRMLRNYAIWAGDEDRIIYYNSSGERMAETKLSEAPDPRLLAA